MSDPSPTPRGWHSRGYLPHFDGGEIPQGTTFRLAGSLPAGKLAQWRYELRHLSEEQRESRVRGRAEAHLDKAYGPTFLGEPQIAAVVEDTLLFFDGERYRMYAWVVMPNHVHALFTPLEGYSLSRIMQSWKGFSAKEANRALGRQGQLWETESLNRFIRNARHFERVVEYIEGNPVSAKLCATPEDWPFSSARRREEREDGTQTA